MSESEEEPISGCPFQAPKPAIHSGSTGLNLLGNKAKRDLFSVFDERSYNLLMSRQSMLFRDIFMINNPKDFRSLIIEKHERVPKSELMRQALDPLIGEGLFISSGDIWKRRRSMVEPAIRLLTPKRTFFHIQGAVEDMLARLSAHVGKDAVDLEAEMSHVTADAVFRAIFSEKLDSAIAEDLFSAFQSYQKTLPLLSLKSVLGLPKWLPGGVSKAGKMHAKRIREILAKLIQKRIDSAESQDDLLDKLMRAKDDRGTGFSMEELVDEIAVLFLAGHETSASVLCWTLFLTRKDPLAFQLINREIDAKLGKQPIDHAILSSLDVARNLFSEGLRLYPPVPFITRELTETTPMRDWTMRKGSMVVVSQFLVQRHKRFWKSPDQFVADRFDKQHPDKINRHAYLPFGIGPRVCPGAAFAMMEGPLVLASIFQRFEFEIESDKSLRPICRLTTRPSSPIYIRLIAERSV